MAAHSRAATADPAYLARFDMRRLLVQKWVAQLNAKGDARSRAAAAFVGLDAGFSDERIGHIRTLRALAEGSQDPLIWQLWRIKHRHCDAEDACGPSPLKPWHDIEPANLMAWLPVFREPAEIPSDHWAGIRKASYARSYQEDFLGLLLPLVAQESPGLALQEGLNLINEKIGTWPTRAATSSLLRSCSNASPPSNPDLPPACLRAAELLWTMPHPNLDDRLNALRLAAAQQAHDQSPWAARVAFMQTLDQADGERYLSLHFRTSRDVKGCDAQAGQRELLQTIARKGHWEALIGPQRAARTPRPRLRASRRTSNARQAPASDTNLQRHRNKPPIEGLTSGKSRSFWQHLATSSCLSILTAEVGLRTIAAWPDAGPELYRLFPLLHAHFRRSPPSQSFAQPRPHRAGEQPA